MKVKHLKRVKVDCPDDAIHVCGKDGKIKGSHLIQIDGKNVYHGNVGYYVKGMKVYFSFLTLKSTSQKLVLKVYKRMKRLHKLGICVKPLEMKQIKVKFDIKNKTIKAKPYAIAVQHVYTDAEKFALGHPYDWNSIDHPDHSPEGFLKFYNWARSEMTEDDRKSITCFKKNAKQKLGDILFCKRTQRWWLVDV